MHNGKPDCYYCKGRGFVMEGNSDGEREAYPCECTFDAEIMDFEDMLAEISEKDLIHDP